MTLIGGVLVEGIEVDPQTRCVHFHGPTDIIAIKFACCGRWFPCYECHAAVATHDVDVWPKEQSEEKAILCGACGGELSIKEYLACGFKCPICLGDFNSGCANHRHLYFELG